MRQRFVAAPGVSLRAISLPGGRAYGIEIDNPSGSWLYLPTLETWVPPYTVGWSSAFAYGVASVDVIAGNGPAGQVGTTQGDAITVYLSDQPVGTSPGEIATGAAFVEGFTPQVLFADISAVVRYSTGFSSTLIAPTIGKRVRIRTFTLSLFPFSGNPPLNYDSGVRYNISSSNISSPIFITGRVCPSSPVDTRIYPSGLDFPQSEGVNLAAAADYHTTNIGIIATYEML